MESRSPEFGRGEPIPERHTCDGDDVSPRYLRPPMRAQELVEELRSELAVVERAIRDHAYLDALEAGYVAEGSLRAFAAEQRAIIASDRRSFAQLAARFPEPPAGDFFLEMAEGEGEALRRLAPFADAVGAGDEYEPQPGCQAYPAYVAWLALNGSRTDVAVAFLANLAAWGGNCRRIGSALRGRYDVSFFEFFGEPAPGFEERALAVADEGLAAGDSRREARRAARLLQGFELLYWDTLGAAL